MKSRGGLQTVRPYNYVIVGFVCFLVSCPGSDLSEMHLSAMWKDVKKRTKRDFLIPCAKKMMDLILRQEFDEYVKYEIVS